MKRRHTFDILLIEAIALVCLVFFKPINSMEFIVLPLSLLGRGLAKLSLHSSAGNILALVLYIAISSTPIIIYIVLKIKSKARTIDLFLIVLSTILFIGIYILVNPLYLSPQKVQLIKINPYITGLFIYSSLITYILLKLVDTFFSEENNMKLSSYLKSILFFIEILSIFVIFHSFFSNILNEFNALLDSYDTGTKAVQVNITGLVNYQVGKGMDFIGYNKFIIILKYIISSIPFIAYISISENIIKLIDLFKSNRYDEQILLQINKISKLCKDFLVIIVLIRLGFNALQLISLTYLKDININTNLGILPVLFILLTLITSKIISENINLKADNDLFI